MLTIVDYGVGNLFSLQSSFAALGIEAEISADPKALREAQRILLPGVGAFADAMRKLTDSGLGEVLKEEAARGKPLLGICLGMQLLFDKSFEYGAHRGLGLIPGSVKPLAGAVPPTLKIPQMGWNSLRILKPSPLLKYTADGDYVYFVHSYYAADCEAHVTSTAEYGIPVTATVQKDNVFGCQFHPEKSGEVGLRILKAFSETEVSA